MSAFRQVGLFIRDRELWGQHNSIPSPSLPPLFSVFPGVLWLCIVAETLYLTLLFTGGALMILEQCPCFSIMNKLKLSAFAALCTALSGNAAEEALLFFCLCIAVSSNRWQQVWCWRGFFYMFWMRAMMQTSPAVIKLLNIEIPVVIQTLLRGRSNLPCLGLTSVRLNHWSYQSICKLVMLFFRYLITHSGPGSSHRQA